jgi:hypothetical protein
LEKNTEISETEQSSILLSNAGILAEARKEKTKNQKQLKQYLDFDLLVSVLANIHRHLPNGLEGLARFFPA